MILAPACMHARALPARATNFDVVRLKLAVHLPSCRADGEQTLRRLFRFAYQALFDPMHRLGGAQIRARTHEPPIAGSIEPGGGGAERGGDM
jgi:hypothetical protein